MSTKKRTIILMMIVFFVALLLKVLTAIPMDLFIIPMAFFFGIPSMIGEALGLMDFFTMPLPVWPMVVWIWLWAVLSLSLILLSRLIYFIYGHFKGIA